MFITDICNENNINIKFSKDIKILKTLSDLGL